ncbi:ROK family protein [Plantibacter flavus]|uniref:ROK family protein n=1 Tax=Plantibacter flavus TaxID=150123 RepID=UPI003F13BBC1
MGGIVLAVDIGGTKTVAALADGDDVILDELAAPTRGAEGPGAVIGTVLRLAARLLDRAPTARLRGVGIGTAGVVDVRTGTIVSSTDTLTDWTGTPVAALVRAGLGSRLPADAVVHVQNDVDAHAAGEFRHGAAAGADSALVIAVGTGVGAGVILDGRSLRGARHVAGEIAHVPTPGAGHLRCPCGRVGHLEAIGSGIGLYRHYLTLGGDPSETDARGIARRAAAGESQAVQAVRDSAAAVGRAIAAAATLLDPERVVITGGVPEIGEPWWSPMDAAFRSEAIDALQDLPIVAGTLGGHAPLRGAAASAWAALKGTP